MFDLGLESPEEIINMSQQDIIQAIGSSANGKKIFTGMRAKFTNIPLYVLMGSHSCFGRGVGKRKMKKLYEAWDGDMTMCQTLDHITNVAGFDTKTAVKIQAGYPAFIKFLTSIEGNYTLEKFVGKKQGSLSGKTFIFTGFRDAGLEKQIIDQGGAMGTAVSSKTSYLVTAEANSTSTKAKAAQAKGVAVIGLEELKRML
jgi:DNA ligase (NAD+)